MPTTDERLAVLETQVAEMRADVRRMASIMDAGAGVWKLVLGLAALVSAAGWMLSTMLHWKGGP